jgi:serine/threonine-protein kinase
VSDGASVSELLSRWLEHRRQGEEVSLAELCAGRPDMLAEVRQQLQALAEMEGVFGVGGRDPAPGAADPGPTTRVPPTCQPEGARGDSLLPHGDVHVPGYEVLGELGRGGMGVVYKARHTKLNRLVALKMILAGKHAGEADLVRFRTEAEAVARLQHPNIVQIHDVGEHEGHPFFSLEYCTGGSLAGKLGGTPLPAGEAARLVETLARAMHAAHQAGVIHRDLKPANVLLTADGTPKVTDFGLAKKLDDAAGQTASGAIMGTPSYMAPEQAGGKRKEIGPATDDYALGAILYECLTGRPPFLAATAWDTVLQVVSDEPVPPSRLQSKVPRDLEAVCLKCLEKEPAQRYASALDLAEDLERFIGGESVSVRPAGVAARAFKWARRRPTAAAAWVFGVTAAVLLPFGGTVLYFWRGEAEARRAEARATRQAAEARQALGDLERARRRDQAQAAADRVAAQLPELRRRALWPQALALLAEAKQLLGPDADASVTDRLAGEESDIRLLAQLDGIRMRKAALAASQPEKVWNAVDIRVAYQQAFGQAGYEFSGADRERCISTAVGKLSVSPIRYELIAALDDWVWGIKGDFADAIWETTARVTGQSWRRELRFTSVSAPAALRLSREVPTEQLTPALVVGLGFTIRLLLADDQRHAVRWLEAGAEHWPADFWVNFYLGTEYLRLKEYESAAGAFRAAAALRPEAPLPRQCLNKCLQEAEGRRGKGKVAAP